ncbi:hypothetical protein P3X46_008085 [Hevea brasiliensis]|uniref:Cytochrome P450 n=1 Tax=Hevea brasiliensis TaxID=3981 RepID=A0ABQ9MHP6_HEVBR|nr:cytochrome P450 89A2 [Hevea brasiliensis]KAJ9179752.1 hypothetical protein P3X46_008085 [Hevea brasiliensis]
METWFIVLISLSLCLLFNSFFSLLKSTGKSSRSLPPGPPTIPIISSLLLLLKSFSQLESIIQGLRAKYGPIITIRIGSRPAIFVTTHSLAHQALVQNGAVFADRPPALAVSKIITSNQHNISSASYGPTWRLLRRNLTSEILHPSRIKSYSHARKWVLDILINRLMSQSESGKVVHCVKDHFQYAMFCLLVLMCFGDKLEEEKIKQVEDGQRRMLLSFNRFSMLNFWPSLTRILFYKRWDEFLQIRRDQEKVLIPLIRARKNARIENLSKDKDDKLGKEEFIVSYVDTLLDLQLPHENRKLEEGEIVSLCSEFLDGGTDTTSTALQWIFANLVKYPHIQEKLFMEIKDVVGEEQEVKDDHLHRMPYLKAVILEGLRRHPPGHFVLPHAVTQDTVLDGFVVPKNGTINFMVAEMGRDPNVWEDPMAFNPERFLNTEGGEAFDVTGSREIKMMPFGVGRRICPGYGLAMLHLEYFVANLVWNFKWMAADGDEVDLSEKQEFTVVMKNPLKAQISPRLKPQNF